MILLYEFRKLLKSKFYLVLILALIFQTILMFMPHNNEHNYSDEVYKNYIAELNGKYTIAKKNYIKEEYNKAEQIISEHDNFLSAYKQNEISLEELDIHNLNYNKALAERSTLEYLIVKCDYFDSLGHGYFFYDTPWEDFFSNSEYNYIISFAVICIISQIFNIEYRFKSVSMLNTSKNGKTKIGIAKLSAAVILAFFISIIIYILQYGIFMFLKGDNSNLGIENLLNYNKFKGLSLRQYYFTDIILKSISWAVSSLFICMISVLVKNSVFTFFISFVFLLCPYFISNYFTETWYYYLFLSNQFGKMYTHTINIFLVLTVCLIKSLIYSAVCIYKWQRE